MKKTINVNYIARVEGEGALTVEIKDRRVCDVKLKIFEPPRFFEALLRGRGYQEAPDITARICGICPVAYQMSAVHAMEDAFGASVEGALATLRRLLYCGEWIESHTLHIYMLHAPDFLGFPDAMKMAKHYPKEVERGLKLKKAGNAILSLVGGREVHPINVKVGGFYKLPGKKALIALKEQLKWARTAAIETVEWVSKFKFPNFERDYEFVSLVHPHLYPLDCGEMKSSKGLTFTARTFDDHIEEKQVPYSTALHASIKGRGSYLVGPMARYHLNYQNLSPIVKEVAAAIGFPNSCRNPFQSIIVRSLEVLYAVDEALRMIDHCDLLDQESVQVTPRASKGYACTEAPRGTLYHRYAVDDKGIIEDALIVPPTSQNQKTIEEDLLDFLQSYIDLSDEELAAKSEQFIRNYDPCISCATHFLKLDVKR